MFHFVTLFTVTAEAEETFVRRLGMGGPWLEQARRVAPALVAADLLRHQRRPMFLCHDIWTTPEAYSRACGNQAVRRLLNARKQMAADSFEIGAFTFPALRETAGTSGAGLPQAESLSPAWWLSTEQLENELCDAAVQATVDGANATTAALDQIDAYFAKDGDDPEKQHRQSLLGLLRLLRPSLAELLSEPSSLP
jgi:hypothetical protein